MSFLETHAAEATRMPAHVVQAHTTVVYLVCVCTTWKSAGVYAMFRFAKCAALVLAENLRGRETSVYAKNAQVAPRLANDKPRHPKPAEQMMLPPIRSY